MLTSAVVKELLFIMVLLLVVDLVWLTSNGRSYNRLVANVQGSDLTMHYGAASLSYVAVFLTLALFAIPWARRDVQRGVSLPMAALKNGALLGACIYAIFNFTNLAIFKDYSWATGLMDTAWGSVLYGAITYITLLVFH
jgi:uncharacterized membrane protein